MCKSNNMGDYLYVICIYGFLFVCFLHTAQMLGMFSQTILKIEIFNFVVHIVV